MRDRSTIQEEIEDVRFDLERTIATLKDVVNEKLDVKAHAREAFDRVRARADQAFEQLEAGVMAFARRSWVTVRRYPVASAAIAGAAVLGGIALVWHRVSRSHAD
ncbi:MAG: DUF3618 domain-containing protein [Kofleriaceae bacterium]